VLTPVAVSLRKKEPADLTRSGDYEDASDSVIPAQAGTQ